MLEHVDLRGLGHNSPRYVHTVTEALSWPLPTVSAITATPNLPQCRSTACSTRVYSEKRLQAIGAGLPGTPAHGAPNGASNAGQNLQSASAGVPEASEEAAHTSR